MTDALHRLTLIVLTCVLAFARAAGADYQIEPGFLYAPSDLTARQFTAELQLVGTGGPAGTSTSAAITRDGLFLYSAYRQGGGLPEGSRLMALDDGGVLVHELSLNNNSLNRASGIAIDSLDRIYVASSRGIHEISPDFSSNVVLPIQFGRASGVAVAPNDFLYVADQQRGWISVINTNRQFVSTIPTGPVPTGVTFGPDGFLYYVSHSLDRLVKVHPETLTQTVILSDLDSPTDIEFAPDGTFYIASGQGIRRYAPDGTFLHGFSDGVIMDQLAFYVPEPSSTMVLVIASAIAATRRCRK